MKRQLTVAVLVALQCQALPVFADQGNQIGHQPRANVPTRPAAPAPSPSPSTPATTTTPDTTAALQAGVADGQAPGAREGRERGTPDGQHRGLQEGYDQGFQGCAKELSQRAYDTGFAQGVQAGRDQGTQEGQASGQQDGDREGRAAGTTDGQNRADSDANAAATPAGSQQGIADANASDAGSRGRADGTVAGDQSAQQDAKSVDYQRGRQAYRNDQYNGAVQSQDGFSQKPQNVRQLRQNFNAFLNRTDEFGARMNDMANPSPDFRYYNPTKTYPTPPETTAYQQGYRQGYISGFNGTYTSAFQAAYGQSVEPGRQKGCQAAHMQNYDRDAQKGFVDGRQKGYADAFHEAHDIAYRTAYDYAFRAGSQAAYQANYQADYNTHFAAARSAAYQQQYNADYQASFDAAKTQKYNQVYPGYAAQQYKQGQADEAQDFQLRPVRLLDAQITGTLPDGIFEPGEALRIKLTLRNFSAKTIAAQNVKLSIQAVDADGTVVSIPSEVLVQNLKPKSLTTVTDALEIRLNESAVGQAKRFVVTASYQERDGGDINVEATAQFMLDTQLAEQPVLEEGMQSTVKIRVTNTAQVASDAGTVVTLKSDPQVLEVLQGQQTIGALQPGQSTVVSFPVVAHSGDNTVAIPFAVSAMLPSGRRVGLLDTTDQVPVQNEYKIEIDNSLSGLRQPGVVRAQYTITNMGSRLSYKGLQVKVSVLGSSASDFQVLGPNPQYLTPVEQGKSISFVVPVLSNAANSGGTLQLEVEEDGRTVDIHRVDF